MISEDYEYDESRITEDESGDSDEQIRRRLVEEQTLVEELEADAEENPFEEDEGESEESERKKLKREIQADVEKSIDCVQNAIEQTITSTEVSLINIARLFKLNHSIGVSFFATLTSNSFSWPNSYSGVAKHEQKKTGINNGYETKGNGYKTYGVTYSPIGFSDSSNTTVQYIRIELDSDILKTYLNQKKDNIVETVI